MQNIKTIAVCGAGTMGAGIAQTVVVKGFKTIVFDLNEVVLGSCKASIFNSIDTLVAKGKLPSNTKELVQQNIVFTTNVQDVIADVVIEAIIENIEAKKQLFKSLMEINKVDTIYATNTSSISINTIASELGCNSNIIGLHFFNPAPIMKLVEVIKSKYTALRVVNAMMDFCNALNKTAVICNDAPGFIVNRVARHYYLQTMLLAEQGVATIETIDTIMQSSGFKMGPFALMDLIGLDINYGVSKIVYNDLGKPSRLKPSELQAQKVAQGKLGKKTGEGFYKY